MKWFVLLFFCAINASPVRKYEKNICGYNACPKSNPNELNVHVVPHSHDDVGWLKTVDQYYYGSRTNIQRAGVQYIIDSVIEALSNNPDRRFIQVETAFFHMWWLKQNDTKKEQVRRLINNGQLEIIGGAWSMNDEAAAHYHSIIDQFSLGLRVLNDTLGECARPKIGWQIDPFGHSKEMASIFAQLGYDGLFFSRLDWRDKSKRMQTNTPEMIWESSKSLGSSSNLFTSVLYNHYSAPSGFCFDIICQDDPIIDDESSPEFNHEKKVEGFADFIKLQAANYATNNIIITMGDDFHYQDALTYFHSLDKLISGFTKYEQTYEDKKINVFYSTPSCYIKAVNAEAAIKKQAFPVKTDDFFPYASDYNAYWSGYFTSRPTSKRFERQGNNLLQAAKQLTSYDTTGSNSFPELFSLQSAMGFMQHHDAITGTEKQHVADDYARILSEAMDKNFKKINEYIAKLLVKPEIQRNIDFEFKHCLLSNISVCQQSLENEFVVAVYNPLSRPVDKYVRLPVDSTDFTIVDPQNKKLSYQISPTMDDFKHIDGHHAKYELVFLAEALPALGLRIFQISKSITKEYGYVFKPDTSKSQFELGTKETSFTIDSSTGLLNTVTLHGKQLNIRQELMYYIGAKGDNSAFIKRASGAYIFRPSPNNSEATSFTKKVGTVTYKGNLYDEVYQTFSTWAKQVIRVYKNSNHIEFDWLVGPINITDKEGREVISRFTTDLSSNDLFYTDSNGREMIQRKLNFRNTYNYTNEEPIAGNYYPVTSKIMIKDVEKQMQLAVLNDRAQGGSSLQSGELELMVHRRLLKDDAFGVGEALNETQYHKGLLARGSHFLTFGSINTEESSSARVEKQLAQADIFAPIVMVSKKSWNKADASLEFAGLNKALPENVHILTLEPANLTENTILLRLEHIYEIGEHPTFSKLATVDVGDLFTRFKVLSIQETTLGGNQWLSENERLSWTSGDNLENADYSKTPYFGAGITHSHKRTPQKTTDFVINLKPMQIRTFIVKVDKLNL